jgi:Fic family protein
VSVSFRAFRPPPESPPDRHVYLGLIDDIYQHDAYNSLSIEGYRVTPDLIQLVASGDWDPDENAAHRQDRDALAARGYYQAFKLVRGAVRDCYRTDDSTLVRANHRSWYRELFSPHVAAGLLDAALLAGYRDHPVYLKGSRHLPPRWEILGEAMSALFDLLEAEPEGAVRAILGHWLLGYLHPFPDGNGRIARFAMNTLFATAGYPWTVIRVEERERYLKALEQASVEGDVGPFVVFIAEQMQQSQAMAGES